ncbi:hypothetical protein AAKU52_003342 [Pedobacter sp. CG_S7]|uniref:heparinase II/III domain-containing protein n=1 Tax=Pedobacter sp. CG_S7 TaxID=3143930 RepID=UPI0033916CB8
MALSYRIFKDKRYLEKARKDLLQLCELKNWGTGHFLDVGEAALAAGVGFDWLYNDLLATEKEKICRAIINNAIIPSLNTKEGEGSWVNGNFNWNPVCHGGVMAGALAVAELEPILSKKITERAIHNLPYAGNAYRDDGAYPEGPSYWSYGTSFYVIAVEALRSIFGTSFELEKIPGFLKTADYNNQMVGPTGEDFNYSDYHIENLNEPVMFWFARELNRYDLIKEELSDINRLYEKISTGKNITSGKNVVASRHIPLEIIWWKPSLKTVGTNNPNPLNWTVRGHLPMAVMRSSWGDPKATFVAIKGGTPNNSHGHMDAGSFILEADGVRWAIDPGTESYGKMRAAKLDLWDYSQNSNRWSTFRVGSDGHNIIRFNNKLQQVEGKVEIVELTGLKGAFGIKADLSILYLKEVKQVQRSILINTDRSVTIFDEWATNENPVEATFQWLTKAKVLKKDFGLLLEQEGKFLEIRIEPYLLKKLTMEIQDVSKPISIQNSANPGLSRILIKAKTAANSIGELKIMATPLYNR